MARDAERALGLMLAAGREVGDIRSQRDGTVGLRGREAQTLASLDLDKNLAADCATFAKLSDDDWSLTLSTAQMDGQPTRAHVKRQAQANLNG